MKTIVVWFSCGAASAVAAKKTIEIYGKDHHIRVVNNPIKEEHPDNKRFLKDVEKWLGVEIEFCTNPNFEDHSCQTVWEYRRYMSGIKGAPCTYELKIRARQLWEKDNKCDDIVLGFTADERSRYTNFIETQRSMIPVLIDLGITKQDCFNTLKDAGIELPAIYRLGYPNANCIGCIKATSPTYWNLVRNTFPEVFEERAKLSRKIGCRLVRYKNKRIFLDELPPEAKARPLKKFHIECGIYCDIGK